LAAVGEDLDVHGQPDFLGRSATGLVEDYTSPDTRLTPFDVTPTLVTAER
jgi:hypothetical protein